MSRILITGADGFTGRYLAQQLYSEGHEVVGITHSAITDPVDGLSRSHVCDLTDAQGLKDVVADLRPEKVAHLAAIAFVAHGDVENIYRTNIVGSRNLLEAISSVGRVNSVLLASSANIYGNQVNGAIDEHTPPNPVNDYAVSKLSMEFVARTYAERLPITVARPFNYTGIGQSADFLIPKIVDHVRRRADVVELGNLDVARDFSDVRDVVVAYSSLLASADAVGSVFNICSGRATSLSDVIAMIKDVSSHDFAVEVNPAFSRANEVKSLWGDRGALNSLTGQSPRHSLRDTLAWMLDAA
ncbi:GDP-mannose 4,6-dehydratase [Sphingobium limneticum]|jgi:nucleoside-diphosphate-sugar epimerase|uniref:GDP-mannose 4,6-dehydratase n=1 Tax=Sphingobium limneticum TaxID=1007511 RepID=UPI003D04C60C